MPSVGSARGDHQHEFRLEKTDYWTPSRASAEEEVTYAHKSYVCVICNQSRTVDEPQRA